MARTETSNFSHPASTAGLAPSVIARSNTNQSNPAKDHLQRSDTVKSEFTAREGTYKISSLIDNLGKTGTTTCLNEPVKITLIRRIQTITDSNSETSSRRSSTTNNNHVLTTTSSDNRSNEHVLERRLSSESNGTELNQANGNVMITEILAFNIGRELIIYEIAEPTQVCSKALHCE